MNKEDMIPKEFVPYEQALALEELGFDGNTFAYYTIADKRLVNGYSLSRNGFELKAPLYQQAFRWFREKYNLFGCIDLHVCSPSHWFIRIDKIDINDYLYHSEDENIQYNTYEEAELACLIKLIQIVKEKK